MSAEGPASLSPETGWTNAAIPARVPQDIVPTLRYPPEIRS